MAFSIWIAKFTVAEFLRRLTSQIWRRSFHNILQFIRYFLGVTFVAVIVATLTECQPFSHYWQVVPDPGPKCRQGYAQLITMGTCDIITDLLLVAFPIPIIHLSVMPMKRKISLILLFGLSLVLVAITAYRVPSVIQRNGSQQYRSLIASLEILAAAAVSNAIVIGSFVRDRGVKKAKFKAGKLGSVSESVEHASVRRATVTHHHWGSDADLATDLGIRLDPKLYPPVYQQIRPAPPAMPSGSGTRRGSIDPNWQFPHPKSGTGEDHTSAFGSFGGSRVSPHEYLETNAHSAPRKPPPAAPGPSSFGSFANVSFNDVGGLLAPSEPSEGPSPRTTMYTPAESVKSPRSDPPESSRSRTLLRSVSGLLSVPSGSSENSSSRNTPSQNRQRNFSRPMGGPYMTGGRLSGRQDGLSPGTSPHNRGPPESVPELQDLGGLLTRDLTNHINPSPQSRSRSRTR